MRVLYCITRSDTIGGAHIHVADLATHLSNDGHDATVLVGGGGIYTDFLRERGIPSLSSQFMVRPISPWRDFQAIKELRRQISEVQPDVLSLHSAKAGVLGRLAASSIDVPIIFTAHGWSFTDGIGALRSILFRELEKKLAPWADRIICVSEYDRQLALTHGVGSSEQLLTIHNGMRDSPIRAQSSASTTPIRLISIARLDRQKDHLTLFAALEGLRAHNWTLDLVGDGPLEANLRVAVKQFAIAERVRFLGLRQDVDQLLGAAHIFVLPSNWEGFPRSILEAMRAALPVVASDVGGVSESVREGKTGFLIPRGDYQSFRRRVAQLVTDPLLRGAMGRMARESFEQKFRFERMAMETSSVYRSLLRETA